MKSSIFRNLTEVNPAQIITDKTIWWACMKNVSETSTALHNGQTHGVGLGWTGNNSHKRHFFYFDNNPTHPPAYPDYPGALGMNNLLNDYFKLNNMTLPYSTILKT